MIPKLEIPHWDAHGGPLSPFSFSSDHFRMFEFKVRNCPRARSHDWTQCPYAHPAEKARRRDPRKFLYSATACPDYRKGNCKRGDTCQLAHGVFECWLHPSRYRTQLCNDGTACRRRVCFFAHTTHQLRLLTHSESSSPTSVINTSFSDSPPSSPSPYASMRNVQLQHSFTRAVFRSPRAAFWTFNDCHEEPPMERVESGRDIRARIYAKLSMENSIPTSARHHS